MMDNKTRNYVIECERITGDVWSPLHMFVDASVAAPVVRCGDCRWYRAPLPSLGNVAMCKRNVVSAIPVDEDGFCAWGIAKTGNKNP